jgi:hypothetical protein
MIYIVRLVKHYIHVQYFVLSEPVTPKENVWAQNMKQKLQEQTQLYRKFWLTDSGEKFKQLDRFM